MTISMMRRLFIIAILVTLLTLVASDIALKPNLLDHDVLRLYNATSNSLYKHLETAGDPTPEPEKPPQTPDTNTPYGKAWCKGGRLILGMTAVDNEEAKKHILPMPSPWDGDLIAEMKLWGWKDESQDESSMEQINDDCDFVVTHELERAFEALGISPTSYGDGGPNRCYKAIHQDGPTVIRGPPPKDELPDVIDQKYKVGEKEYQATGAEYTIGVNPDDGIVYYINRLSPRSSAEQLWERNDISDDEMPALKASSDIAWGFYNQALKWKAKPLNSIKKLMCLSIVHPGTEKIINEAISHLKTPQGKPPRTGPQPWPGDEFLTSTQEGKALLGTANGQAVAYFLAQHKAQLGLKHVTKITVFFDDVEDPNAPNMLFWVEDVPPPKETKPGQDPKPEEDPMDTGPGKRADISESRVLKRGADERNFIREHIFYAKL